MTDLTCRDINSGTHCFIGWIDPSLPALDLLCIWCVTSEMCRVRCWWGCLVVAAR